MASDSGKTGNSNGAKSFKKIQPKIKIFPTKITTNPGDFTGFYQTFKEGITPVPHKLF